MMFAFEAIYAQKGSSKGWATNSQNGMIDGEYKPYEVLDTRIDNMRYWMKAAELGLTPYNTNAPIAPGTWKGSKIDATGVVTEDSPDIPVTDDNTHQSENSIFVDPLDPDYVLQSNNSVSNPVENIYGANYFLSDDAGLTWGGSIFGAGGDNRGDPSTAIGLNGRRYVGYIHSNNGQGIAWSDNGINWNDVVCGTPPATSILDKNHMWIDNSPVSPYEGNIYSAWTAFGNQNANQIELVYSNDDGLSYSSHINISSAVNSGSHDQGVNITTGPDGQVYAFWSIYDSWPSDETAIGFARSMDGGATWEPAVRIIQNIRGVRFSGTTKTQRVNSFPVASCDIGGDGDIYVVWANIGVPRINDDGDIDIYMAKSSDEGDTWSVPIRVNQDDSGLGKQHYFPWITCDPETSTLSVVFYDDRNVGTLECETFCANSYDGGESWEDFRVSDVSFTPWPIQGLSAGYMGDYLGISARGGQVYPVWTDNRDGHTMTYTSPYSTNLSARPTNLTASLTFETGEVQLNWQFSDTVTDFLNFNIYRNGFLIGTSTDTNYVDMLPEYGLHKYKVTALFLETGESAATRASIQWGNPHVTNDPIEIIENIGLMSTSIRYLTIENSGELPLVFNVSSYAEPISDNSKDYCYAEVGYNLRYIENVKFGDIDNSSGWQGSVADYTDQSTTITVGGSESMTVECGSPDAGCILRVWVDWNNDYVFEEGGSEQYQLTDVSGGQGITFEGDVTVPQGTPAGDHRMRVRLTWSTPNPPCGWTSGGDIEDYTIYVSGWMQVDWISDTVAPGETEIVEVSFNSDDLIEGTYYGNIFLETNDLEIPLVDVPITLNVGEHIELDLKVFLEGPFNGTDMNTHLTGQPDPELSGEDFPLTQPYNTPPWNYSGTESITTVPDNTVDWVLVELRDAVDANSATEATVIERQAAFVLIDGSVVGLNGTSNLSFNQSIIQSLYTVVRHRNHIDIMSANPLTDIGGVYTYDYTTSIDQVYGGSTGYKSIAPGVFGMAGGDANTDGTVDNDDKTMWEIYGGAMGYLQPDLNFDGQVNNPDKDEVWILNADIISSQVPE